MPNKRLSHHTILLLEVDEMANTVRILVVDDNRDFVKMQTILMRQCGYDADGCHSGAEALVLATSFQPNAVMLDIGLPDMNGRELCKKLRDLPGGGQMMLIAHTGHMPHPEDEECFDARLTKPASLQELQSLLQARGL